MGWRLAGEDRARRALGAAVAFSWEAKSPTGRPSLGGGTTGGDAAEGPGASGGGAGRSRGAGELVTGEDVGRTSQTS